MLKRIVWLIVLACAFATGAHARARYSNWCQVGNQAVTITGAGTSSTKWQLSGPACTVTVYLTGTLTLASLYSNNSGTVLANPFTAAANGSYFLYADNGRYDIVTSAGGLPTSVTIGDVFLIDTASLSAATAWSGLTDPAANLSLSMATYTSTFTWGNMATTANSFSLTDGSASTSTGSLFRTFTGSGSTMKPFTATAQGTSNGVQMSSAGTLAAIGTGSIDATDLVCSGCLTDADLNASGITTRSKLPSTLAYEDEANVFTQANVFNSTVGIKGGTAFTFTVGGTPTGNRTITIPDATSTLVNLSSAQTMANKTFSDNLAFQSGTAFTGTFDHAISANRTWTMPNAAGTVLLAPTLTTGAVMFNNGTTLDEDPTELFWNTTTKRLGLGNAAPAASLHVQPRAAASEVAMRVQGDSTANTDVLQVYNSAGSPAKISFFASNGGLNTSVPIISTQTTGTAPFTIASTTVVSNLNVDQVDGADWAIPGTIGSTTPNTGAFTTLTASTSVSSPVLISGSAGVSMTGATGALTFLGLGAGTDENLVMDLNAANVATFTSGTGVTLSDWSGIGLRAPTVASTTSTTNPLYLTTTNCSDSAGDAACGAAPSGAIVVDAADTATVVSTTAITANSNVFLQIDAGLGARLSVTCNTQAASVFNPRVTARTAATSFTITVDAGPTTNPLCLVYWIVN